MNLKGLKSIKVALSPFSISSTSAKVFLYRIQTTRLSAKFSTCKIETNFDSKLTDPSILLTFSIANHQLEISKITRASATSSKMMLIPLSNLKTIYTYLLNEGVMVVKKDVRAPKHAEINVPNLQVMKALLSLKSRGYVSEQFSWQHFYYFLTDEGILFLRSYLHLPETVVPLTLAKAAAAAAASRPERDQRQNRSEERVGGEYRREWRNKSEAPAATAH